MAQNYQLMLDKTLEDLQGAKPRLLLQVCCAPCSSYVLEYLNEYSDKNQIIMFTCHKYVSDTAKDLGANSINMK